MVYFYRTFYKWKKYEINIPYDIQLDENDIVITKGEKALIYSKRNIKDLEFVPIDIQTCDKELIECLNPSKTILNAWEEFKIVKSTVVKLSGFLTENDFTFFKLFFNDGIFILDLSEVTNTSLPNFLDFYSGPDNLWKLSLPKKLETIQVGFCCKRYHLNSVKVPSGLKTYSNHIFKKCNQLETPLFVPQSAINLDEPDETCISIKATDFYRYGYCYAKIFNELYIAAENGDLENVKKYKNEYLKSQCFNKRTALSRASFNGHVNCVKELLEETQIGQLNGFTALMLATQNNHIDCIKILIPYEHGIQNEFGQSALIIAIIRKNIKAIKLLLPYEKDIKVGESSILDIAIQFNDERTIGAILPYGLDKLKGTYAKYLLKYLKYADINNFKEQFLYEYNYLF